MFLGKAAKRKSSTTSTWRQGHMNPIQWKTFPYYQKCQVSICATIDCPQNKSFWKFPCPWYIDKSSQGNTSCIESNKLKVRAAAKIFVALSKKDFYSIQKAVLRQWISQLLLWSEFKGFKNQQLNPILNSNHWKNSTTKSFYKVDQRINRL